MSSTTLITVFTTLCHTGNQEPLDHRFTPCHSVMLDAWQSLISALESIVMLPSLVQTVFRPSIPPKSPKQYIHDVAVLRTVELRKMDDFLREVKRLFEAPLQPANLLAMSGKLQDQFQQKLQDSNICMLPSYTHTLPTGDERGTYLALDVGGSTFRVALVELCGKHKEWEKSMRMVKIESYRIDNSVRALKGHAFFDWMAERIAEVLDDAEVCKLRGSAVLPMGMAWSFPVEYAPTMCLGVWVSVLTTYRETSIHSGRLLDMGKGFSATMGVLGEDLGELVMRACRAKVRNLFRTAGNHFLTQGNRTLTSAWMQLSTTLQQPYYLAPTGFNRRACR